MEQLQQLATAIPELSQVPQCILPAYGAMAAAGCGADLACICGHDDFFVTLQGVLIQGSCTSPVEVQDSITSTQKICSEAAPWLNDNRSPEILASIIILTVLASITVLLRIIARRMSKLKFGADDWLILVSLLFSYGLLIVQCIAVKHGFGRHILMIPPQDITIFTKVFFATTVIFPVTCAAAKLSVLFFYHRIFPERRFRIISTIIGVVVIVWFIAFIFLQFFTCVPLAFYWDKTIPDGHCIDSHVVSYAGTSPLDIITNVAILILPIPYLWKLQMQWQKKLAITIIFLLGSFATVGSIVRVPLVAMLNLNDITYSTTSSGVWLNVEANVGILSISLPVLRPLFSKAFPSGFRSRFTRSRTARYGTGSQRLPDVEKGGNTGRSSTLIGSTGGHNSSKAYSGGRGTHKTWYNNAVSAMASKNDDRESEGSQEEMVPMGRIAVRHDLDWDTKDSESAVTRNA